MLPSLLQLGVCSVGGPGRAGGGAEALEGVLLSLAPLELVVLGPVGGAAARVLQVRGVGGGMGEVSLCFKGRGGVRGVGEAVLCGHTKQDLMPPGVFSLAGVLRPTILSSMRAVLISVVLFADLTLTAPLC